MVKINGEDSEDDTSSSSDLEEILRSPRSKNSKSVKINLSASQIELQESDKDNILSLPEAQIELKREDSTTKNHDNNDETMRAGKEGKILNRFDALPDEILVRIYSFCDVPSIGRMAQVCKRFNSLSEDLPMWREVTNQRNALLQSGALTKSYYIRKFKSFRRRQKQREEEERQKLRQEMRKKAEDRCSLFMLATGFGRIYEWLVTFGLITTTILAVLKLDGKIDAGWHWIMFPFYLVILQLIYLPILYDGASAYFNKDFEDNLSPPDHICCSPVFYFIMYVITLGESGTKTSRAFVYPASVNCAVFLLLFIIKSSVDTVMPWWVVFLPLLIECTMLSILLITGVGDDLDGIWDDESWLDRVLMIIMLITLFLSFLFLGLKLDNTIGWSWIHTLIPLFILKGFVVVFPILLTLISSCGSYSVQDITRWSRETAAFCMIATAVIVLLIVPLLVMEILLAQHADGENNMSYVVMFIPLFIIEGCACFGCIALNVVAIASADD